MSCQFYPGNRRFMAGTSRSDARSELDLRGFSRDIQDLFSNNTIIDGDYRRFYSASFFILQHPLFHDMKVNILSRRFAIDRNTSTGNLMICILGVFT